MKILLLILVLVNTLFGIQSFSFAKDTTSMRPTDRQLCGYYRCGTCDGGTDMMCTEDSTCENPWCTDVIDLRGEPRPPKPIVKPRDQLKRNAPQALPAKNKTSIETKTTPKVQIVPKAGTAKK